MEDSMNKKVKNIIIFAIFLLLLFVSTFTRQFRTNILWPDKYNVEPEFSGLQFKDPSEIEGLSISRSIENNGNTDLIKMDISFNYKGQDSILRILGTPQRELFLNGATRPVLSITKLKGDYEKINQVLFSEKLKYKDFYKKIPNYNFQPVSVVKIPLTAQEESYRFTLYALPRNLFYKNKGIIAYNSVFVTNARVEKYVDQMGDISPDKQTFQQNGYYVNTIEVANRSLVNRIKLQNTLAHIVFFAAVLATLSHIWLNRKNVSKIYVVLFYLIILGFYRVLGLGASMAGILIIAPILAYIAALACKLMDRDKIIIKKKDFKQALIFTIAFYVVLLIIVIIPRAIY